MHIPIYVVAVVVGQAHTSTTRHSPIDPLSYAYTPGQPEDTGTGHTQHPTAMLVSEVILFLYCTPACLPNTRQAV